MTTTQKAAPSDPAQTLPSPATGTCSPVAAPERIGASDGRRPATGRPPLREAEPLQMVAAALLGSLPVLWVLGALPWRSPTLLIDSMFRGFAACAIADGALNPLVMVCPRAGAPIGMHQLDGGLSYPLGGVFVRLGVEPQAAWKLSVALLIVPGVGALFWLLHRMTGSMVLAAVFVNLNAFSGTLTARTWNWYWNVVAVVLLPLLFALLYVLYDRARARRLRPLLLPGATTLATIMAIGVEWQYAGLFATAVALAAVAILTVLPDWSGRQRLALVAGSVVGVAVVSGLLRVRLTLAGITDQFDDTLMTAGDNAIDVVAFVAPDPRASLIGLLLDRLGRDDLLVGGMAAGRQLWVAPYLGVASTALVLVALVVARRRRRRPPQLPTAFLALLVTVTLASIVLSTGPQPQLAGASDPSETFVSPLTALYGSSPLRWIRYPWTWGYVTHVAGLLTCAAAVSMLRAGGARRSPLVGVVVVILAIEFISPQVLDTLDSVRPSLPMATGSTRIAADHPAVERFESRAIPELHRALRAIDGPVLLLPWGNTYIAPRLGPESGAVVRNVGIDRNLAQVEAAAPFRRDELRRAAPETVQRALSSGWASGVVMLDHVPSAASILRLEDFHLRYSDSAWTRRVRRMERRLTAAGFCVTRHSWFTVFTQCTHHHDQAHLPAP